MARVSTVVNICFCEDDNTKFIAEFPSTRKAFREEIERMGATPRGTDRYLFPGRYLLRLKRAVEVMYPRWTVEVYTAGAKVSEASE